MRGTPSEGELLPVDSGIVDCVAFKPVGLEESEPDGTETQLYMANDIIVIANK